MKNNSLLLFTGLLLLSTISCSSEESFKYSKYRSQYQDAVDCIIANCPTIFTPVKKEIAVSLYPQQLEQLDYCHTILNLIQKESIDFISVHRDTTISFYKNPGNGFFSKQKVLIYFRTEQDINQKIPSNSTIIKQIGGGWYELERVISLAN